MPRTNQARPCWYCPCLKEHLHEFPLQAIPYTHETYMALISASRTIVVLGLPDLRRVVGSLEMDFRDQGSHGRALNRNIDVFDLQSQAAVRLCKWSRLDLGGSVFDVHVSAAICWSSKVGLLTRCISGRGSHRCITSVTSPRFWKAQA